MIDRPNRQTRSFGDRVHARAVEAALREQCDRRRDDRLDPPRLALLTHIPEETEWSRFTVFLTKLPQLRCLSGKFFAES